MKEHNHQSTTVPLSCNSTDQRLRNHKSNAHSEDKWTANFQWSLPTVFVSSYRPWTRGYVCVVVRLGDLERALCSGYRLRFLSGWYVKRRLHCVVYCETNCNRRNDLGTKSQKLSLVMVPPRWENYLSITSVIPTMGVILYMLLFFDIVCKTWLRAGYNTLNNLLLIFWKWFQFIQEEKVHPKGGLWKSY